MEYFAIIYKNANWTAHVDENGDVIYRSDRDSLADELESLGYAPDEWFIGAKQTYSSARTWS